MTKFDVSAFLTAEIGPVQTVHEFLDGKVPVDTIYKWTRRQSIPSDRLTEIFYLLEKSKGVPVSVVRYMEPENDVFS